MMFANVSASMCEPVSYIESPATETIAAEQKIVFRQTQKMRAGDGRMIYFYRNGKCEGFDGDRLIFVCDYLILGNEVRLLDERGVTVYKGTITWKVKGLSLASLTLNGDRYYAVQ